MAQNIPMKLNDKIINCFEKKLIQIKRKIYILQEITTKLSVLSLDQNKLNILFQKIDRVESEMLLMNATILTYDYVTMKDKHKYLKEQIIAFGSRPERVQKIIDMYGIDELENYL
jgi:hypothetical protein